MDHCFCGGSYVVHVLEKGEIQFLNRTYVFILAHLRVRDNSKISEV